VSDPRYSYGNADIENALTQFAQCISVLSGQDRTRPEVMVEESRPILKKAIAALRQCGPNDAQDAARYRWLRDAHDCDWNALLRDGGEEMDAVIDERISATGSRT
jgi:hypothetical protein